MRSAYSVLVKKPEGKKPLGKPRPRWEDNIKKEHSISRVECGLDMSGSE